MKKIFLFGFFFILFSCGPKKQTFEDILNEAGEVNKKAISSVNAKSSGFYGLASENKVKLQDLKVVPSENQAPYSRSSVKNLFTKDDEIRIRETARKYFGPNSFFPKTQEVCPENSQIIYHDPPPELNSQFFKTDYYTRKTAAIEQVATELDSAEEILSFVSREIANEPLIGATQSADMLLKTKRGTYLDKTNLIAALFMAKGIPTQLVSGFIFLSPENAKKYLGVSSFDELVGVLDRSYVYSSGFLWADGNYKFVKFPHIWARSFVNGQWKNFDPGSMGYVIPKLKNIGVAPAFEPNLSHWLFEPDENGAYIRPKTYMDSIYEKVTPNNDINIIHLNVEQFPKSTLFVFFTYLTPFIDKVIYRVE